MYGFFVLVEMVCGCVAGVWTCFGENKDCVSATWSLSLYGVDYWNSCVPFEASTTDLTSTSNQSMQNHHRSVSLPAFESFQAFAWANVTAKLKQCFGKYENEIYNKSLPNKLSRWMFSNSIHRVCENLEMASVNGKFAPLQIINSHFGSVGFARNVICR